MAVHGRLRRRLKELPQLGYRCIRELAKIGRQGRVVALVLLLMDGMGTTIAAPTFPAEPLTRAHLSSVQRLAQLTAHWATPPQPIKQPTAQQASDRRRVEAIVFRGNRVTQESTLLRELNLDVGDQLTREDLDQARQRVMDLGLFKDVTTEFERIDGVDSLVVAIEEKHYWFVLPKLSRTGDGDLSYGIGLKYDNLFGLNHELEFSARKKEFNDTDIDESETARLEYAAPRFFSSIYDLDVDLRVEQSNLDEDEDDVNNVFDRDLDFVEIQFGRWLDPSGVSKGWRFDAGLKYTDYEHEFVSGDPDRYYDATVLSLIGGIQYFDVQDFLYSREGRQYGLDIEQGISTDTDNDDDHFSRISLFWREYRRLEFREHSNLNMQLRLGYARHPLFDDPTFSLAGSRTLRGFERDSIEGDRFVVGNIEWMTPILARRPAFRGVVFADVGTAWDNSDDLSFSDLRYSVGVGFRWRIRALVKTELRVDYAHGFKDGIDRVYVGTRSSF